MRPTGPVQAIQRLILKGTHLCPINDPRQFFRKLTFIVFPLLGIRLRLEVADGLHQQGHRGDMKRPAHCQRLF